MRLLVVIQFLSITLWAYGAELALPPAKNYFDLASWRQRRTLEIPEDQTLVLVQDTAIKIDEFVLLGKIVTNGFQLQIETLKLTFGPQSAIVAFTSPAKTGSPGKLIGNGINSVDEGGKGGDGRDGGTGDSGDDGVQLPGAIVIHTVDFVGTPNINGAGQNGGQGGKGGPGGQGGQGGKGKNAWASCDTFPLRRHGHRGGQGGQGGQGGMGGVGGQGGRPVPVIFAVVAPEQLDSSKIVSIPGQPGEPGPPGDPGGQGPGGEGGEPKKKSCAWGAYTVTADRGPVGPKGEIQKGNLGPGTAGLKAFDLDTTNLFLQATGTTGTPRVESIANFNRQRLLIAESWFHFHWARSFLVLFYETLTDLQVDKDEINKDSRPDDILASLLGNTSKERASILVSAWENHFLANLESPSHFDDSGLKKTSLDAAKQIVLFLKKLMEAEQGDNTRDELLALLASIQSNVETQFSTKLQTAIHACDSYVLDLNRKSNNWQILSSYYSIPVCMGKPDFSDKKNLFEPIALFIEQSHVIPTDLISFVKVLANIERHKKNVASPKFIANFLETFLFPFAFARNFSVSEDELLLKNPELIKPALLSDKWIKDGQGTLSGFPAAREKLDYVEIRSLMIKLSKSITFWQESDGEK